MSGTSRFQILIVDDEKVQLEMLKGFLVKQGYGVDTAEDGKRGLEKFQRGSFDLILTDLPDARNGRTSTAQGSESG